MIKINKTTHIMILSTFALIFVVVYLYYTINDVKKLSVEVKKNAADITKLTLEVQNAMSVITNLNKDVLEVKGQSVCNKRFEDLKDDAQSEQSSVDSEMLKKIIVGEEDEETEVKAVETVAAETTPDFQNMKYEELRDELKRRGMSTKGTKLDLIARLSN